MSPEASGVSPEIRIDQLTGLRTVLAPGRAERPDAFAVERAEPRAGADESCPFCEGREDRTPPEVWANRPGGAPDAPGWTQRAVPNLYPALGGDEPAPSAARDSGFTSTADPLRSSTRTAEPELFKTASTAGAHEVIINSPEHHTRLIDLGPDGVAGAMEAWRTRMQAHAAEARYLQLILNEGPEAGASLEHTHAQLYAMPFVPPEVARERERSVAYNERTMGSHLLEDVMVEEVRRRDRLVAVDSETIVFCPWSSRGPFELRLVPRTRESNFERDSRGGQMLHRVLAALAEVLGEMPQFNLWVRNAPRGTDEFHWHLDILPRLTTRGGFEFGTGVETNIYPPERAAADLRDAIA